MAIRDSYSHAIADEKKRRKRKESDARLAKRAKLSNAQQLEKLDALFGKGKGAKKERARLKAEISLRGK